MAGQLPETFEFAHVHTVSDASQETVDYKAYELVEPADSVVHWKVLSL